MVVLTQSLKPGLFVRLHGTTCKPCSFKASAAAATNEAVPIQNFFPKTHDWERTIQNHYLRWAVADGDIRDDSRPDAGATVEARVLLHACTARIKPRPFTWDRCLEGEGYSAADGAGGIYQIDGLTVLAQHGHIALG
jgi:hypothetical protein